MDTLICEKCHAGMMLEYERVIGTPERPVTIKGLRCERCGFTSLSNDEEIWQAVGL